jgi:hypothetical protein
LGGTGISGSPANRRDARICVNNRKIEYNTEITKLTFGKDQGSETVTNAAVAIIAYAINFYADLYKVNVMEVSRGKDGRKHAKLCTQW